jgi:hypothetical protein
MYARLSFRIWKTELRDLRWNVDRNLHIDIGLCVQIYNGVKITYQMKKCDWEQINFAAELHVRYKITMRNSQSLLKWSQ